MVPNMKTNKCLVSQTPKEVDFMWPLAYLNDLKMFRITEFNKFI